MLLEAHADFFTQIESSPLNSSRAGRWLTANHRVTGTTGGRVALSSVLVARGWLSWRVGQADVGKFFLLARLVARRQRDAVSASAYIRKRHCS